MVKSVDTYSVFTNNHCLLWQGRQPKHVICIQWTKWISGGVLPEYENPFCLLWLLVVPQSMSAENVVHQGEPGHRHTWPPLNVVWVMRLCCIHTCRPTQGVPLLIRRQKWHVNDSFKLHMIRLLHPSNTGYIRVTLLLCSYTMLSIYFIIKIKKIDVVPFWMYNCRITSKGPSAGWLFSRVWTRRETLGPLTLGL